MSFTPRAVALDLDGTLLSRAGELPPPVVAAVGRVVVAGVPVVLATGRSWRGTRPVAEALDLPDGYAVCANGAVVMRYSTPRPEDDQIVRAETFDPAPIVAAVLAKRPDVLLAVDQVEGYYVNREFPDGELTGAMVTRPVEQMVDAPVTRLIVRDTGSSEEDFAELAGSLGLHEVQYYVGYSAWLDIAGAGVTKALGLDFLAQRLGVRPEDVLAIGDGRNDVEMLRWAGRGVAMGDAPESVAAEADAVTGTFDEGGAVTELSRWFG